MTARHAAAAAGMMSFVASAVADTAGMPTARLVCWIAAGVLTAPQLAVLLLARPAEPAIRRPAPARRRPQPHAIAPAATRRALPAGRPRR